MDFKPYYKHYEMVVQRVESAFEQVKTEYTECVTCKLGCSDCCHALFDLSLIEAMYIKAKFDQKFSSDPKKREQLLEKANQADREIYRIKRNAYKDHQNGKSESEVLAGIAGERVRCPLLNEDNQCDLYDSRPITCRLYGIPTEIGGKAHTCGLSAFEEGKPYPTVKLDEIHKRLYEISFALAHDIKSRFPTLAEVLVPLSMALLTDYSKEYLGIQAEDQKESDNQEDGHDG
jgi:Fe-S-cluster containining protein